MSLGRQIALDLKFEPSPGFGNFIADANAEVVSILQGLLHEPLAHFIHLWGQPGSGKSHLLQALCAKARENGRSAVWLPLHSLIPVQPPSSLIGLENLELVAVDDLDALQDEAEWQEALYGLYNGVRQAGGLLVSASRLKLDQLQLGLPDLRSRLNWGPAYRLLPISDAAKAQVLRHRAQERGLELPDESLNYLLNRYSRNLGDLMRLLEQLDLASLEERRRLSLPFVRQWLLEHAPDASDQIFF